MIYSRILTLLSNFQKFVIGSNMKLNNFKMLVILTKSKKGNLVKS